MTAPVTIIGRYALYGEIAAGGMATVHFGRLLGPVGFSRTVAIKRLHPQYAKDPEFVAMFLDEARLAARIRHPNVVQTLDVVATNGELFLVMDYVQGESLSRLARKKPVPPKIVAAVISGVLHGLHAAHEAKNERGEPLNIVHRDISPQNILVGIDGNSRVLDFGVAKASGRAQTTREGHIKGKIAYMAPEQFRGAVTRQTDVYATAIVAWEALTGERLFSGADEVETLSKALSGKVALPSSIVSTLLPAFDDVIMKGLSVDPAKRYATAREMALALERCDGLASPSEVGEWVDERAKDALSKRLRKVSEIESSSPAIEMPLPKSDDETPSGSAPLQSREPAPDVEKPVKEVETGPALAVPPSGKGEAPAPKRRSITTPLAAVGVAVLLFFALRPIWHTPSVESPARADATPAIVPTTATGVDAVPPVDPPVVVQPSATPDVASAPAASAPAPAAKAPTVHAGAVPGHLPGRKNCDPAFTIDAAGHKHYKPECL